MVLKQGILAFTALSLLVPSAVAADAPGAKADGIETMVVSASRYAQRLLDVPVSMSVVDAEAMDRQGVPVATIDDEVDMEYVPFLVVERMEGSLELPLDGTSISLLHAGAADGGVSWRDDTCAAQQCL